MNHAIDILTYINQLKEAGVPAKQASIHANQIAMIVDNNLTSKEDLKAVEASIKNDMKDLEIKIILTFLSLLSAATALLGFLIEIKSI